MPQAIAAPRESAAPEPRNATFHDHLGMAYAKSGDKAKARIALLQALVLSDRFEGKRKARQALASLGRV